MDHLLAPIRVEEGEEAQGPATSVDGSGYGIEISIPEEIVDSGWQ